MNNFHKTTKLLIWSTAVVITFLLIALGCADSTTGNLKNDAIMSNQENLSIDIIIEVELEENTCVATYIETILNEIEQISNASEINGSFDRELYIKFITGKFDNIRLEYYESTTQIEQSNTRASAGSGAGGIHERIERCCTSCFGSPRCNNCTSKTAKKSGCYYRITRTIINVSDTTYEDG